MDELVMKGEHGEDQRAGDDPSVLEMKSTLKRSAMKALEKKLRVVQAEMQPRVATSAVLGVPKL